MHAGVKYKQSRCPCQSRLLARVVASPWGSARRAWVLARDSITPASVLEEDEANYSRPTGTSLPIELVREHLERQVVVSGDPAVGAAALGAANGATRVLAHPASDPRPQEIDLLTTAHQWGTGLTVPQFIAALQALPLQQQLPWKSVCPAIGVGSRGRVYQAVNMKTGGMLAVKVVSLASFMGPTREGALRREALVLELAAMQDYLHNHLLAMQGFYFHPSLGNPRLEIYSELGVCLEDLLPEEEGLPTLGLVLVQKVMRALVEALAFLHGKGVVHRDVKPGNIVSTGPEGVFKLIDMDSIFFIDNLSLEEGLDTGSQHLSRSPRSMGSAGPAAPSAAAAGVAAADVAAATKAAQQQQQQVDAVSGTSQPSQQQLSSSSSSGMQEDQQQQQEQDGLNALSYAGTPENMAPEAAPLVLEASVVLWDLLPWKEGRQAASTAPVEPSRDVWSVGTVLWELATGRAMFREYESPEQLYQHFEHLRCAEDPQVLLPALPAGVHPDLVEVLQACLQVDPTNRATAKQLLQMDFFNKEY